MENDRQGRIILINGASSSGKTTVLRALRAALPELWLEMGIDRFAYSLPDRVTGELTWQLLFRYVRPAGRPDGPFRIATTALGHRFISGMHAAVAAVAASGLNVMVDHVVLEPEWVVEMDRRWGTFDVVRVGVRCPLEVIVERERARRDRTIGQAEAQFDAVHRWMAYDVEVDPSVLTPGEAAARILTALEARAS